MLTKINNASFNDKLLLCAWKYKVKHIDIIGGTKNCMYD